MILGDWFKQNDFFFWLKMSGTLNLFNLLINDERGFAHRFILLLEITQKNGLQCKYSMANELSHSLQILIAFVRI